MSRLVLPEGQSVPGSLRNLDAIRCDDGRVLGLSERPVDFNYDYWVRCPACPERTPISSAVYDAEPNGAHIDCSQCGSDIHFGPAVLACRDPDDSALSDREAAEHAWYHTSTDPQWPQRQAPGADLNGEWPGLPSSLARQVHSRLTTQALHLGTYEAAIESMLRRMRDQGDGGSRFYLFRVRLDHDLRLEPGFRDENHEAAAQITQPDLQSAELDAIRYLNVHESPGSISLAVQRDAVAALQQIEIPLEVLRVRVSPSLLKRRTDLFQKIDELGANRSAELDVLEQFQRRAAARRGEPFAQSHTLEQQDLCCLAEQALIDEYLLGVSLPIRHQFSRAMEAWRVAQEPAIDDATYTRRFASMAALLTHSDDVIGILAAQPWNNVT
jgi:hypothetical protein